jgi:adenylyl- and sulfurtransferase ThiI
LKEDSDVFKVLYGEIEIKAEPADRDMEQKLMNEIEHLS